MLDGKSAMQVAKEFGDSPRAVAKWVERFKKHGATGLEDAPKPGRPSTLTPSQEKRIRVILADAYKEFRRVSGGTLVTLIKAEFGTKLTRRQCERILRRILEPKMKYFAYGSNMLNERLRARVSSAGNPTLFTLPGWTLRFHKKSTDGSGKCNLVKSASKDAVIHGIIFDVAEIQIGALDEAEGLGKGYSREKWKLEIDGSLQEVSVYLAETGFVDDSLVPYDWYRDLVLAGAEQHALPEDYVTMLQSVPFVADKKLDRAPRLDALKALAAYARSKKK